MTPHINASKGDFADTVLMPGDPLRAKFIAENYLSDVKQVCDVRNILGFTGTYKGQAISVMASGMGTPSMAIYANELINEFGVKQLIRVGSCGAIAEDIELRDIIVPNAASTGNAMNRARFAGYDYAAAPDFSMLKNCWDVAQSQSLELRVGNIFTSDFFYEDPDTLLPAMKTMNILAYDMESAALFTIAAKHRVKALSILTVSDHVIKGGELTTEERQSSFDNMMKLALETAIKPL
ncbi:purine-nucleoside phosphorylase [Shewanella sp. 1_MG-2023]|uniref:purine-nucleoside phosphorylase n=1 Tax=unclassified Shewanella TaxID=196818 RepID=UPI0026E375E4|nr:MULTISPECIES: purine-nucleoside phosphorylase [unclassified Shewanella]MDO6610439.1 purine-nucleoside phosphorylase [Shewanella sp. 7_MG-2023]MDO6770564.1 purine-nucleoside phosphorylase [Shewanella sp. 2_MG-2023]MDO6794451.1 purine-nucleoside phosphorylase [Shewanella sp. 1_MG-2023]